MFNSARMPAFITQPLDTAGRERAFDRTLSKILNGELPLKVHYQPIVDMQRGIPAGYEALVRLPATLGDSLDDCYKRADVLGKRLQLEQLVVQTALQSKKDLPPNCFLSINVSIALILSRHWEVVLFSVPDLAKIILEIRQEEQIENYDTVRSNLCLIRTMGGFIAVDNAGSGYASLRHILEVGPDFIKLDTSLVKDCNAEPAKSVLIEMLGKAADRLDAWIIAKGVETQAELHELLHLEVPLAQGSYLDRPYPTMRPLREERAAEIRLHSYKKNCAGMLAPHVEVAPTRTTQQAARMLLDSSTAVTVVVVDPWNRPVHIWERHPLIGVRGIPHLMTVQISTDPSEALHRALTRPAATRFDPIAVIDPQGTLQGVIHIDRLSRILLAATTKPQATPIQSMPQK
jgi:EAL domain-containing protein (putative c-di-GMP-specific phosphodiesterase class I)